MRRVSRVLLLAAVAFGVLAGPASAQITVDQSRKMSEIFTSPNQATNSDLAFWGKHAFVGYYTGDTGFPAGSRVPRRSADLRHLESGQPTAGEGLLV